MANSGKHFNPVGVSLGCYLVVASACLWANPVAPQAPTAKVNVVADPGDLSGVWISSRFNADRDLERGGPREAPAARPAQAMGNGRPPLLPWATAILQQRQQDEEQGHPYASPKSRCLPAGTPGSMSPPAALPIQILETPGQITVLFEEFNYFRIIRMNQKHLADPDRGYFGDSVGHWEGDTLVVDTIGLSDKSQLGNDVPHTKDLHVIERLRHVDKDTIEDRVTMEDPKTFTGVWQTRNTLKRVPGIQLAEYFCENDRNPPDATGKTGVQLPSR